MKGLRIVNRGSNPEDGFNGKYLDAYDLETGDKITNLDSIEMRISRTGRVGVWITAHEPDLEGVVMGYQVVYEGPVFVGRDA